MVCGRVSGWWEGLVSWVVGVVGGLDADERPRGLMKAARGAARRRDGPHKLQMRVDDQSVTPDTRDPAARGCSLQPASGTALIPYHPPPAIFLSIIMKVPSLALAALATASLATPTLALGDALVDLALWGAGALSSPPRTGRLPGGPPEGGWSWTNCGTCEASL